MRISRYEVLLKIIELGSLTKAAKYYNYTQSAVSQIVHSLENEMGVTLLNRGRSGVTLTREGAQLYPYICDISSGHRNLSTQLDALSGLKTGTVRIGAFSSVSCHWLPSLITEFQRRYPQIQFDIMQGSYAQIETWTLNGIVDLGFVSTPSIKGLDVIPICRDPFYVIIPETHPLAKEKVLLLSQLEKEPFIMVVEGDETIFREIQTVNNIHLDIQYRVQDDYTVMAMVECGMGIGMLPKLVLFRNPYDILQKPTEPCYFRSLGIAIHDKTRLSPSAKRFLQFIMARFLDAV